QFQRCGLAGVDHSLSEESEPWFQIYADYCVETVNYLAQSDEGGVEAVFQILLDKVCRRSQSHHVGPIRVMLPLSRSTWLAWWLPPLGRCLGRVQLLLFCGRPVRLAAKGAGGSATALPPVHPRDEHLQG